MKVHPCDSVVLYGWHQKDLAPYNCPLTCKCHFLSPLHLKTKEKQKIGVLFLNIGHEYERCHSVSDIQAFLTLKVEDIVSFIKCKILLD